MTREVDTYLTLVEYLPSQVDSMPHPSPLRHYVTPPPNPTGVRRILVDHKEPGQAAAYDSVVIDEKDFYDQLILLDSTTSTTRWLVPPREMKFTKLSIYDLGLHSTSFQRMSLNRACW